MPYEKQIEYLNFTIDAESGKIARQISGKKQLYRNISGELKEITLSEWSFNGDFIKKMNLVLIDDNYQLQLSVGFNTVLCTNLLNTLRSFGANWLGSNIKVSTYRKKDDGTGNKSDYIKLFVESDGTQVPWRYSAEEVYAFGDRDTINNKLFEELQEIRNNIEEN